MLYFDYGFILLVILQRLIELAVAKKNEKWMKSQGAVELGQEHYPFIVLLHVLFFGALILEVTYINKNLSQAWPILLGLFIALQVGRIWIMNSLGRFWNTKIIILPHSSPIKNGPYQFMKHPNYLIVSLELLIIPLLFNAYTTAILFTILNIGMLSIRIPVEERALGELTDYHSTLKK